MNLASLFLRNDTANHVKAGYVLFREGELGDSMFVLFEGIVDVHVKDQLVGSFEAVEILGEMAVISPGPRSATVIAHTDCKIAAVSQKRFMLLLANAPELGLHIMRMLVERIRFMNEASIEAQAQIQELKQTVERQTEELGRWRFHRHPANAFSLRRLAFDERP